MHELLEQRLQECKVNLDESRMPYCVLFTDSDPARFERLGGGPSSWRTWAQTSCVGETRQQCTALVSRVKAAFEGWHPVVPGRNSYRAEHYSNPAERDDALPGKPRWVATDEWLFTTVPGTP